MPNVMAKSIHIEYAKPLSVLYPRNEIAIKARPPAAIPATGISILKRYTTIDAKKKVTDRKVVIRVICFNISLLL